jgi:very-short-patch-repair endonuclease
MNTKETLLKSKDLRRSLTPEEAVLWTQLKSHKLNGSKWRKQHPIEPYILDFYCASAKLCIELDGQSHYTFHGSREDDIRTQFLNSKGIRVIRFENRLIWDNLQGVLDIIKTELGNKAIENKEY